MNLDANNQPKGLNRLDEQLQQVRIAMANGLPAAQGKH